MDGSGPGFEPQSGQSSSFAFASSFCTRKLDEGVTFFLACGPRAWQFGTKFMKFCIGHPAIISFERNLSLPINVWYRTQHDRYSLAVITYRKYERFRTYCSGYIYTIMTTGDDNAHAITLKH